MVIENLDNKVEARRKKGKQVLSKSGEDLIRPNLEKKHVEEEKLEKEKILISAKVEAESKMKEAQGPNKAQKEDIRIKDSSWISSKPIPFGPMTTALTEEPVFTKKLLAAQDPKDGKVVICI